jgi:F-type H+-transporting ATPase subunit b
MSAIQRAILPATVMLLLLLGAGVAQNKPSENQGTKSEQAAPAKSEQQNSAKEKKETPGQELAEASKEAEGEGEENAEFKQSASVKFLAKITGLSLHAAYWLAIGINFAVIAAAIIWFAKSSLPGMFRSRTQSIRKTMDEAQRASADASRRLGEVESRLARLDADITAMRAQAEAEAAAEEQRIKAAAEEDARKLAESAGQEIEAASRLALRELKAHAAELAVSLAEKRIQVDAKTDQALVDSFVGELGRDGKEGK